MKICLFLMASLVAMAFGHNDGGSYSAKKADKLSFKESLIEKIHNIKDKIHAKISAKKEKVHAKKALKHGDLTDRGAQPAADCSTVVDEVWEEQCSTKYEPSCRMEMQPHCTSIQAKECAPESQTRCSFVFEDKCKTISVPKCTIDWEKRCTSTPDCTTIEAKSCTDVEKDVCVTHMDKTCTMSTVNVCRKVAVRESTPVVDTVERIGLKASIKAKAAAHKAQKKSIFADKLASKGVVKAHSIFKRGINEGTKVEFSCRDMPEMRVHRCDGHKGCADGSDEEDCEDFLNGTLSTTNGDPEFWFCKTKNAKNPQDPHYLNRIPSEQYCNGVENCWDHSDETECVRESLVEKDRKQQEKDAKKNLILWNERCLTTLQSFRKCESDDSEMIDRLRAARNAADLALNEHELKMTAQSIAEMERGKGSKSLQHIEDKCFQTVQGSPTNVCDLGQIPQLYYRRFKKLFADRDLEFHIDAYNFAQDAKRDRGQDATAHIGRGKRAVDGSESQEETVDEAVAEHHETVDEAVAEHHETVDEALAGDDLPLDRTPRSLKGDVSDNNTDFKAKLKTFKAGFKAAKDQYHEAKAQFKATTKALIHAKLNKGDKGSKASLPSIRVRYEKSCQDEPRKICTKTPRQVCHKENVPLCKSEPRETCVQREKCKSWPTKNCGMVHKETCLPFPTKKCTEVSTPVCKIVPRQECTEKKREICKTVPTKDCQKVLVTKPRTVCIPRPTTRTIEDW